MAEHYNKIVFGGNTLIDLTADTITPEQLANGVTAHDATGAPITGTSTKDSDTTDATAKAAEVLVDKTFYAHGAKVTGTMPASTTNGDITTVAGEFSIPMGFHDGSGKVKIKDEEQAKLVATNIREGVEILGVTGTMSGLESVSAQIRTVTPSPTEDVTVIPEEGYNYLSQVVVSKIPYSEVENAVGGITVTIAEVLRTGNVSHSSPAYS